MAAKRRSTRRAAAPRRRAAPVRRTKRRRTNTLNRSVKKPMQALGVAVGVAIPYLPAARLCIAQKSIKPITIAGMSTKNAIEAGKNAVVGYVAGTVAGTIADKAGLKKPINKIRRTVKSMTGGLI